MHNLLKINIVGLLIIIGVSGCRKDPPIPPVVNDPIDTTAVIVDTCLCKTPCEDFPTSPEIGWFWTKSGPQYIAPQFNPNNPDEFVFLRTGTAPVAELVKYNMATEEMTVLSDELNIISPPQWGKTGWITFNTLPWRVWKIKDDGTELTELTFGVKDQYPHFNFEGDRIYYQRSKNYSNEELDMNPDLYNEYKIMGIDLNGVEVDSILAENVIPDNHYQKWNIAAFQKAEIYFIGGNADNYGLYKLDLSTELIEEVYTWAIQSGAYISRDIVYHENSVYISKYRNDMTVIDLSSGIETKIKCGCQTSYIDYMSISPSGDKILFEKVINTVLDEWSIDEQHEIWVMDIDGCNERKILGE